MPVWGCPAHDKQENNATLPFTDVGLLFTFSWCRGPGDHRQGVGRLVASGPDPDAPDESAYTFELMSQAVSIERRRPDLRSAVTVGSTVVLWPEDIVAMTPITAAQAAATHRQALEIERLKRGK